MWPYFWPYLPMARWHDRWHDVLFLSKYIVVEVCRNEGVGRIMLYNTLLAHKAIKSLWYNIYEIMRRGGRED